MTEDLSAWSIAPELARLRQARSKGRLGEVTEIAPGVALLSDPALGLSGTWRSPAGRLLELDCEMSGAGNWLGLHLTLHAPDLTRLSWIGFACRSVAEGELMIRPCLRSGSATGGFVDSFFARHMLADPEPRNHVDALHPETLRTVPMTAPWRELVLFLPCQRLTWHLHDLRIFAG